MYLHTKKFFVVSVVKKCVLSSIIFTPRRPIFSPMGGNQSTQGDEKIALTLLKGDFL